MLYDFVVAQIAPSTLARAGYLLVEHEPLEVADFIYSLYDLPEKVVDADSWQHGGMVYRVTGTAYLNQIEYIDDNPQECDGKPTCSRRQTSDPYSFRGNPMWWGGGFIYRNLSYPAGSQCFTQLLP